MVIVCLCVFLQEKLCSKTKKWRLWRSPSGDLSSVWKGYKGAHKAASEGSDSPRAPDSFTAAVAAVLRAPPKNFRVVRQEWAAIRIQTAFRGFLVQLFPLHANKFLTLFRTPWEVLY